MRYCKLCSGPLPVKIEIDGRVRNLQNRLYCLACSPFGAHNTRRLTVGKQEHQQRREESNRAKYRKYQRKMRRHRKGLLIQMLGGNCQICGYSRRCNPAYDFHHRDPAKKSFEITTGLMRQWEEVVAEARKCVVLCKRCHAEVHDGLHKDWERQLLDT